MDIAHIVVFHPLYPAGIFHFSTSSRLHMTSRLTTLCCAIQFLKAAFPSTKEVLKNFKWKMQNNSWRL